MEALGRELVQNTFRPLVHEAPSRASRGARLSLRTCDSPPCSLPQARSCLPPWCRWRADQTTPWVAVAAMAPPALVAVT